MWRTHTRDEQSSPELPAEQHRTEAIKAIEIVGDRSAANFGLEHLPQRCGEVLRVARGDAAGGLRDQRTIAIGGVGRAAARGRAIKRVVGGGGAVVGQVARIVVGEARDLVGVIVGRGDRRGTVELHSAAIAGQVV